MKSIAPFLVLIIFVIAQGCLRQSPSGHTLDDIDTAVKAGELSKAGQWAEAILNNEHPDSLTKQKLLLLIDSNMRISADFTLSEAEIILRLKKEFGEYSQNEKSTWEKNNWLECRVIDGEKRYFKRAAQNLKLILQREKSKQNGSKDLIPDKQSQFCLEHSRKVIAETKSFGMPVAAVNMKVTYRLTVDADAVPDGQTLRCWLPWPRETHDRQGKVVLLKTIPKNYFMAPDTVAQRSIYLEQKATKGKPSFFEIQYIYQSMAQYFDLNKITILPYDTTSQVFKQYTAEQFPQIMFTPRIRQLSDSIVGGESDPVEKVRKLYYWINNNIMWTGALEYSIMPFIPGYVLANGRGDCGMQTLLFMTMARYQKIPVKWQSGWMMHPGEVNLHDWSEVYYNGVGWIPLDMSFNLQNSVDLKEKEFYISGIDSYRLIINDAIQGEFVPKKKFPRSEPYDFQRGEVEWSGGNLYFNKWDYKMSVEY
jgi:hypothetical protein